MPALATTIAPPPACVPRGLVLPLLGALARPIGGTDHAATIARFAAAMLDAGVATEQCYAANDVPAAFIEHAFSRWVSDHGADWISRRFGLQLSLAQQITGLDAITGLEQLSQDYLVIAMRPMFATPIVTRELFDWARSIDPRFARTIERAIESVQHFDLLRVWNQHAARNWIGERGWEEELDVSARIALRPRRWLTDVDPLSVEELRRARWPSQHACHVAAAIVRLYEALEPTRRVQQHHPSIAELEALSGDFAMEIADPLPALLVRDADGDVIDAAFDMAFEHVEGVLMPSILIKVGCQSAAAVKRAFNDLAAVFTALRAYVHFLDTLPGQARWCLGGLEAAIEDELRGLTPEEHAVFADLARDVNQEAARYREIALRRHALGEMDPRAAGVRGNFPVFNRIRIPA